ncbi:MAG: hypothetical protein NT124_03010 [Candidatus Dependentiae bacterium]|nr:hypothetical protein [Candidatus Dependentiae bacterium]
MKYIHKTYLLFVTMCTMHSSFADFITYELIPGSRLGDHLITYSKAKLASYLSGLPLYCPPFKMSDQLALSIHETYVPKKTKRTVILDNDQSICPTTYNSPIEHVCTLKTAIHGLKGFNDYYRYARANPTFKAELMRTICPLQPITAMPLPANMITVAVHVRMGGGFDKPLLMKSGIRTKPRGNHQFADQMYPQRFPPEEYYSEQIAKASQLYNNKPLFVHIFTDDQNPSAIVARFKKKLSHLNITFSCRATGNAHDANVLDDLFNMMRFDCLIRPASSYSKIAQLLGNHSIIIYPKRVHWIKNKLVADKIGIINNILKTKSLL